MRKLWLLIPSLLVVTVLLYGCDEELPSAPDQAKAVTMQAVSNPSQGPPLWLPKDCADGQTITYDASASAFVCADPPSSSLTESFYRATLAGVYVAPLGQASATVDCNAGDLAMGGGWYSAGAYFRASTNGPTNDPGQWQARFHNEHPTAPGSANLYAICRHVE